MDPWNDVLNQIKHARKKLSITKHLPWYRGVKKSTYELVPKLLRDANINHIYFEKEIYHRFIYVLSSSNNNSWDNLVKLQHYGTPTRLLDWTDSFAVALYFALDNETSDSPCVWLVNPFTLSAKTKRNNNKWIEYFHTKQDYDYFKCFISEDSTNWPYEHPIPFVPPTSNPRILAQSCFFTVHGNNINPLEQQCPKHVAKIEIPPEAIIHAREFLELSGADHRRLFPDIYGFSDYVNKELVSKYS